MQRLGILVLVAVLILPGLIFGLDEAELAALTFVVGLVLGGIIGYTERFRRYADRES